MSWTLHLESEGGVGWGEEVGEMGRIQNNYASFFLYNLYVSESSGKCSKRKLESLPLHHSGRRGGQHRQGCVVKDLGWRTNVVVELRVAGGVVVRKVDGRWARAETRLKSIKTFLEIGHRLSRIRAGKGEHVCPFHDRGLLLHVL